METLRPKNSPHKILRLHNVQIPARTVKDGLAQVETATVQITGVKANPTDKGVEIILQTPQGDQLTASDKSQYGQ